MAKYTWIEIETEEDFIEAFGENPRWILSSAPIAAKSNTPVSYTHLTLPTILLV